ncbi:MAG: hypothetical protein IJS29_05065 [Selenomonadaceae bacterium]|nr:hypothetical protein [Selenomonadaceae bacterium]
MFKRIIKLALTIFLSLCLSTVYAATPKYSADKAVLAYAEMYTYGTSENVAATGLPQEFSDEIKKRMQNHLMLSFKNYPLNPENFAKVQTAFVEKLQDVIKISTRLKVDDAKNPVVEVTANHIDQKAVDALKEKDSEFMTLDVMRHISEPLELATDGQFQDIAVKSILGLIAELPVKDATTFDVPCKLIEDGDEAYWMPQDIESLSKFIDPVFKLKEPDPQAIDNLLIQIFGGMPAGENPAGNSTEG